MVARVIQSLPDTRKAIVPPWHDPDLKEFDDYELAVACAIKHAQDPIIVVSIPYAPLSNAVRAFAARRKVRIIPVSGNEFERAALDRLSIDHNTPAPSHWEPPFAWSERFVQSADVGIQLGRSVNS